MWSLIDKIKTSNERIFIASLDIKGAYDNVTHEFLNNKIDKWVKHAYIRQETADMIRFLYNQYKLGIVEGNNSNEVKSILVNIGVP